MLLTGARILNTCCLMRRMERTGWRRDKARKMKVIQVSPFIGDEKVALMGN